MSEPKKKTPKRPPARLETISLSEMKELWPVSDEGRLCARLLQRYGFTLLVETAAGAECGPMTAQSEAAANKAIAKIVRDFGTLAMPEPDKPARPTLPVLNRFRPDQPEKSEKK